MDRVTRMKDWLNAVAGLHRADQRANHRADAKSVLMRR